jgi:hypothetical protein
MYSRDSESRPLCPWNPHPNRLYALRLALVIFSSTPIEAQIHIKALTFFNNVCHQGEKNTEKKLARRELTVKGESSNSWFICVNKILRKYDLKEAYNYLDNPIKKLRWISLVKSRVNDHWCTQLTTLDNSTKGCNILVTTTWASAKYILFWSTDATHQ